MFVAARLVARSDISINTCSVLKGTIRILTLGSLIGFSLYFFNEKHSSAFLNHSLSRKFDGVKVLEISSPQILSLFWQMAAQRQVSRHINYQKNVVS